MTEQSIQLIAAFGLFVLGLIIGIAIQRTTKGDGRKIARLQQKLSETEDKLTRYQADVTSHFMDTARKVQSLNKSYREVHEQLSKGARTLCEGAEVEEFLSLNFDQPSKAGHRGHTIEANENSFVPPMDYAPKDKSEAEGTLSENFGFKGDKLHEFDESLEKDYKNNRA